MSKSSKEFEWRMQGMMHALDIAKKSGIEGLEKEIRMRGFFKLHVGIPQKDWDSTLDFLVRNLHNTYKTVTGITLHDVFGFGKKRLADFEAAFDRKTKDATDFDYLGQHYVTLEDYATQLRDDFGMHIDVERVAKCQEWYKGEEAKEMADVRELIKVLREAGFEDAAKFIETKI